MKASIHCSSSRWYRSVQAYPTTCGEGQCRRLLKGRESQHLTACPCPCSSACRELYLCYLTVKTAWSYLHSSGYNTSVWRTDGQTDGDVLANTALCTASNAAAFGNTQPTRFKNPATWIHRRLYLISGPSNSPAVCISCSSPTISSMLCWTNSAIFAEMSVLSTIYKKTPNFRLT